MLDINSIAFFERQLKSAAYIDALTASGISRGNWDNLRSNHLLSRTELRTAYDTLQDVINCSEAHTGLALTEVPVELTASVIVAFADPVNWQGLAVMCANRGLRSAAQMAQQGTGMETSASMDPTAGRIMAWMMMVVSSEKAGVSWKRTVNNALMSLGLVKDTLGRDAEGRAQ